MIKKKSRRLSIEHARWARKAAYWEPKYNEWKKHGAICPDLTLSNLITDNLLQGYMDKGWNKITEIYKDKIMNKNKSVSPKLKINYDFETKPLEQQELILEILGSIRKYIINTTFKCVESKISKNKYNEILTVGSNNITSDYDVTIMGPNANNIMWNMFISFLAKYEDALPEAFDSNLYSSPLYIHTSKEYHENIVCKSMIKLNQRVNYKERYFTLVPFNNEDLETELNWACIKLIDLNIDLTKYNFLNKYINNAKKYLIFLNKLSKDINKDENFLEISLQNNLYPGNTITKDTVNIIRNYYLQWYWQKPMQKFIYSNDEENFNFYENKIILDGNKHSEKNIFFYSNISNYFSSDAYYTSSSVNAVVINEQMNIKLDFGNRSDKIIKGMYLVAAIENFGDLIINISKSYDELSNSNDKILIKKLIIKYSKYLYRIFEVLIKAGNLNLINKTKNIYNKVLPFRKSYNIDKANELKIFEIMYYYDESIKKYIEKLKGIILNEIKITFKKI